MNWYQLKRTRALEAVQSSEDGLTAEEAALRLKRHGPNELPEAVRISRLKILFRQFAGPLILVLLVAAAVTLVLGEYIDTGVILTVVLLNAVIGYVQEFKAGLWNRCRSLG